MLHPSILIDDCATGFAMAGTERQLGGLKVQSLAPRSLLLSTLTSYASARSTHFYSRIN